MKFLSDLPIEAAYRVRGNYFVPEGRTLEDAGTHYVEGHLIGVALPTEGGVVVHLEKGEGSRAARLVVYLTLREALPVLRSLYALAAKPKYRAKVCGLRIDVGIDTSQVYYRCKYGRAYDLPKAPAKEVALYAEGINEFLYKLPAA